MTENTSSEPTSSEAPSNPPHTYDRNHPDQQEVTAILAKFNKDPLSIISLGKDGVLRPELEDVDGSNATEEELWHPDASLLPRPMSEEQKKKALAQLEESQQQQA
jgi:hypothetical protein